MVNISEISSASLDKQNIKYGSGNIFSNEFNKDTFFLYDKATSTTTNCMFNLIMLNGYYTLNNNKGLNLIMYDENLLKFVKTDAVITNENLFKIDLEYILKN